MKKELIANAVTFVVVMAVGISALVFGYMGVRPGTQYTTVTLELPRSAQLVTGSSVLLRGVRIGEVADVSGEARGVTVRLKYPSSNQVPADSQVTIEQLTAMGEPYVEFAPSGKDGPYLSDGAVLDSQRVSVPTSIADMFRSMAALSKIADAGPLSDLVKTAWQATTGTEQAMPQLTEAGNLLTTTLVSRMPQIRKMFADTQIYSQDMDWFGPALDGFGPAFGQTIDVIRPAVDKVLALITDRDMPRPLNEIVNPFLARLNPYLQELIPKLAEILGPSLPILKAVDNTVPPIDFSAFLASALAMVGDDGAPRLAITVPVPGGPAPAAAPSPSVSSTPSRPAAPSAAPTSTPSTTSSTTPTSTPR